uniref:Uncharacterized protein n=1 Tax=Lepeophtheirus salmonis TaxID=72036 RepID=A0A0K2T0Y1_LEPSM
MWDKLCISSVSVQSCCSHLFVLPLDKIIQELASHNSKWTYYTIYLVQQFHQEPYS